MKKGLKVKVGLLGMLTVCSLFSFGFTSDAKEPCSHNTPAGTERIVTEKPTCTTAGYVQVKCRSCNTVINEYYDNTNYPALKHKKVSVTEPATCTKPSYYITKCERCGKEFERKQQEPAKGHSYTDVKVVAPATCKSKKQVEQKCSCGATRTVEKGSFDLTNHVKLTNEREVQKPTCESVGLYLVDCAECGTKNMERKGTTKAAHNYSINVVIEPATCSKNGKMQKKCACGAVDPTVYTIAKDLKNGHSYTKNWKTDPNDKPTCVSPGTRIWTCDYCGGAPIKKPGVKNTEHRYTTWVTGQQATCTKPGTIVKKCADCGHTQEVSAPDKLPATGIHKFPSSGKLVCVYDGCNVTYCDVKGHKAPSTTKSGQPIVCERVGCGFVIDENNKNSMINKILEEAKIQQLDSKVTNKSVIKDCKEFFDTLDSINLPDAKYVNVKGYDKAKVTFESFKENISGYAKIATVLSYYEDIIKGKDLHEKEDAVIELCKYVVSLDPATKTLYTDQLNYIQQRIHFVIDGYMLHDKQISDLDLYAFSKNVKGRGEVYLGNITMKDLSDDNLVKNLIDAYGYEKIVDYCILRSGYEYEVLNGTTTLDFEDYVESFYNK